MPALSDCVVLIGPDLVPHRCSRFAWSQDTITAIEGGAACDSLDDGALVVIPGLYNGHTHVGDGALPDGATGLTLEEGFFRPHGYKYRELAKLDPTEHQAHLESTLQFMARTGTIAHLDFREQGTAGADLLRAASKSVGLQSIILSQFENSPFDDDALDQNEASLPPDHRAELQTLLSVADGFSESTMNDLTDPAWSEIKSVTRAMDKLRAIHCLENAGYRNLSLQRAGRGDLIRALELLDPQLIIHLTAANSDEIKMMAAAEATAVLNPRANTTLGLPVPPILPLLDAGANLLLGTDNVMLNPPNLFAELDFTYRLARSQAGEARPADPSPASLLRMVTSNIAPVLGGDHHGYLAEGLPASFVVLNFHAPHLRHTRNLLASIVTRVGTEDILATVRHGQKLWGIPMGEFN